MMKHQKLSALLFAGLLVALLIMSINMPTPAQAGPLAGFTPTPSAPNPPNNPPTTTDDGNREEDQGPTDTVEIQLNPCGLVCSINTSSSFATIAAADSDSPDLQILPPANHPIASIEVMVPVHLIHQGSGFIVEGILSSHKSTHFLLPYNGQWEVIMVAEAQFMTAQAIDTQGLNMADLAAHLLTEPISLGWVEANAPTPQRVNCPVCATAVPTIDAQSYLPETGATQEEQAVPLFLFVMISGLSLTIVGLTFLLIIRLKISTYYDQARSEQDDYPFARLPNVYQRRFTLIENRIRGISK